MGESRGGEGLDPTPSPPPNPDGQVELRAAKLKPWGRGRASQTRASIPIPPPDVRHLAQTTVGTTDQGKGKGSREGKIGKEEEEGHRVVRG